MRQRTPFVTRSLRAVVHDHEDLPAIHAGFLVLSFLLAAMFRLGFFALLIAVRILLDLLKEREVFRRRWLAAFEGAIRASWTDLSLLALGLTLAMVFHPAFMSTAAVGGLPAAIFTLSRGLGMTLPKFKILLNELHVFFHLESYLHAKNVRIGTSLSFGERVATLLLGVSLLMLLTLPFVLPVSWQDYGTMVLKEMIPWRL
jgi:hypothetical protein